MWGVKKIFCRFLHKQKYYVLFFWLSFLNEFSYNNELGPI